MRREKEPFETERDDFDLRRFRAEGWLKKQNERHPELGRMIIRNYRKRYYLPFLDFINWALDEGLLKEGGER